MGLGNFLGGALGFVGARQANRRASAAARENLNFQREVAQNQLQWRVSDARKAGVHPSVALGVSPIGAGSSSPSFQNELSQLGQGFSSGLRTSTEKAADNLKLQNMKLQNDLLANQVAASAHALRNQPGNPNTLPSGIRDSFPTSDVVPFARLHVNPAGHHVNMQPAEIRMADPRNPIQEAGNVTGHSFIRTRDGFAVVPSMDAKERMEDQILPSLAWLWRTSTDHESHKPRYQPRMHHEWIYDPIRMEWREVDKRSKFYRYLTTNGWKRAFRQWRTR